jgi:hypothetical protein
MYVGIIGLALPIGVISSNFADVYAEHFDEVEEDAKRAEEEAAQMDGAVSLSLKQKPLKQINVQPQEIAVGKVIPASNDESKYDGRFSPPDSKPESVANAQQLSHPIGSIPASIAMLQAKFQELNDIKKEWDDVMAEVESIIL